MDINLQHSLIILRKTRGNLDYHCLLLRNVSIYAIAHYLNNEPMSDNNLLKLLTLNWLVEL